MTIFNTDPRGGLLSELIHSSYRVVDYSHSQDWRDRMVDYLQTRKL